MIIYLESSILTSPADVLVNTVNTQGVMGKGLALQFKKLFPKMFEEYQSICEDGRLRPGVLLLHRTPGKSVLSFPTKTSWRQPSQIEYIKDGLRTFVSRYEELGIDSVAFPQLGCGNGGLDWELQVRPIMEDYLQCLPIKVFVHIADQHSLPEHMNTRGMRKWLQQKPTDYSAIEAWEELISLVETSSSRWSVSSRAVVDESDKVSNESVLTYMGSVSEPIEIGLAEFVEFWRSFRSRSFTDENDVPPSVQSVRAQFIELVSNLPVVETVKVRHASSTPTLGLQSRPLHPLTQSSQQLGF